MCTSILKARIDYITLAIAMFSILGFAPAPVTVTSNIEQKFPVGTWVQRCSYSTQEEYITITFSKDGGFVHTSGQCREEGRWIYLSDCVHAKINNPTSLFWFYDESNGRLSQDGHVFYRQK